MSESALLDSMKSLQLGAKQESNINSMSRSTKAGAIPASENDSMSKQRPRDTPGGARGKISPKSPKPSTSKTHIQSTTQTTQSGTASNTQTTNNRGRFARSWKRGSKNKTPATESQTPQPKQEKTGSHISNSPLGAVRTNGSPNPPKPLTSKTPSLPIAQNTQEGTAPKTQTANNKGRSTRSRKRGPKKANSPTEPQKQEEIKSSSAAVENRQAFVYVVQAWFLNNTDRVIGVYTSLSKANQATFEYAATLGISRADIVDISSSVRESSGHMAIRRAWPNGASDIRIMSSPCPVDRINVLPKDLPASAENTKLETLYMALDMTPRLFIIGAYSSKEEAWEACRKYWTALAFSTSIENMEQWYDEELLFHAKGRLSGVMHHWFVRPYIVDVRLDITGSKRGKSLGDG